MRSKSLSCLLAAVIMLTFIPQTAFAGVPAESGGHEKTVEATIQEIGEQFRDETRDPYNYIDTGSGRKLRSRAASDYPERFDLRNVDTDSDGVADSNYVTPVKLQNPFGSCWGFAAIAAAETSILGNEELNDSYSTSLKQGEDEKEIIDLSEKHLVYFAATALDDPSSPQNGEGTHYIEDVTSGQKMDMGGVPFYATSLFSSGTGPNLTARAYPVSSGITDGDMDDILAYRGRNGMRDEYCYSPDDDWSIDEEYRFLQSYKLKESFILPNPAGKNADKQYEYNPAGTEAIKKQIFSKRAVQIGFKADKSKPDDNGDGKYISRNWAHYTYEKTEANHAVTIVGWDDDYDKSNFVEGHEPPENGAWLVKNSWGSGEREFPDRGNGAWGLVDDETGLHTGYFWLSYYDQSLQKPEALDFDQSNIRSRYYIDQHDYMPVSDADSGVADAPISTSNIFRAEQPQKLTQVSCQTAIPGTTVIYDVYLLSDSFTNPQDGVRVASEEETYEFGGFHKISLSTPVLLQKGQKYSIVITQTVPDGRYAYSMQYGTGEALAMFLEQNSWQKGIINDDESFICIDGEWLDLDDHELLVRLSGGKYDLLECDNFPIKGYSVRHEIKRVTFEDNINRYEYTGRPITPKVIPECECNCADLEEGKDYEVSYENNTEPGTATVTVTGKGDHQSAVSETFTIVRSGVKPDEVTPDEVTPEEVAPVVSLSKTAYTYNGKARKPSVTVSAGDTVLSDSDYTVRYASGRKNVGTYTVTVSLTGRYTGSKISSFRINPKGTSLKRLVKAKKAVTVKWKKQSAKMAKTRITGYQIQLATDSKFTKNRKLVTVKGYKKVSKKISKLKGGKKYHVRIRTYKVVNGKKHYSHWSKAKTVTTKK